MSDSPQPPSFLTLKDGNKLAYFHTKGKVGAPSVVFLGGFMSDMSGTKATAIEQFCKAKDYSYTRFDYFGHGISSGTFTDGTIGYWKDNVISILDMLKDPKHIVIGSSMGGWLMLLAALERPEKIQALIGIASAPDFTENLIWDIMTDAEKETLQKHGVFNQGSEYSDSPYPISKALIEDGRNHLVLNKEIPIHCPVRLIHGMKDDDVPYSLSAILAKQLASDDVQVQLIKRSDHRMSSPEDIAALEKTILSLIEK